MTEAVLPPPFAGLEPASVWRHFETLCRIPRASKAEGPVRDALRAWADAQGLSTRVDEAGNLIVGKPASPGREHASAVALQAHLDMVCQKNAGSAHDFSRDPIVPRLGDGWLVADDTTLGADNGIGAALMLAVLGDRTLVHGPLEALFTVDEEAGMGGAQGLAEGALTARLMLNLDTEDWGEFYVGCAGGLDVNVSRPAVAEALPAGFRARRILLSGLRGGHSGVDIHEERGNAIKLLVRVLRALEKACPDMRLVSLSGGTARNALPRDAAAVVALPDAEAERLAGLLAGWQLRLRDELAGVDERVALAGEAIDAPAHALPRREQAAWLASLHAAPHGVKRWSRQVPGIVETSNNLGVVEITPDGGRCNFMVRSLTGPGAENLGDEIASLFALTDSTVELSGHYPGWAPEPDAPLLALCRDVFRREFGADSTIQVVHAGLECGLVKAKHPDMQIVSFGPTIRGAHAPGERVEIESVGRCWKLLTDILAEIAARG